MPLPGSDPEALLVRLTVVSVALQSLVARLMADGILDQGDIVAMRETGLQLAADLRDHAGVGVGDRLEREVAGWWSAAQALGGG